MNQSVKYDFTDSNSMMRGDCCNYESDSYFECRINCRNGFLADLEGKNCISCGCAAEFHVKSYVKIVKI